MTDPARPFRPTAPAVPESRSTYTWSTWHESDDARPGLGWLVVGSAFALAFALVGSVMFLLVIACYAAYGAVTG